MASIENEVNRNVYNEDSNISNDEGHISPVESEMITNTDHEIEIANEEVGSCEIPVECEMTSKNKHETENENENSIISNNGSSIHQIESEIVSKNKHETENLENLASVSSEYIAHDSLLKERLV